MGTSLGKNNNMAKQVKSNNNIGTDGHFLATLKNILLAFGSPGHVVGFNISLHQSHHQKQYKQLHN